MASSSASFLKNDNEKKRRTKCDPRLVRAIKNGDISAVTTLVEQKVDLNLKNKFGHTPLMSAIMKPKVLAKVEGVYRKITSPEYFLIAKLLLENGADPNIYNFTLEDSPLFLAARYENAKIAILILQQEHLKFHDIDLQAYITPWYSYLLDRLLPHLTQEDFEILFLLKKHGAEFSEYNNSYGNLLHAVVYNFCNIRCQEYLDKNFVLELMKFFLDNGVNPNGLDRNNRTPLETLLHECNGGVRELTNYKAIIDFLTSINIHKAHVDATKLHLSPPGLAQLVGSYSVCTDLSFFRVLKEVKEIKETKLELPQNKFS